MKKIITAIVIALLFASCHKNTPALVILHTNDTHSQVEPHEKDVKKYGGLGGYARRMQAVNEIRANAADSAVILVDAGDFFQGTPYFNLFHGKVEVEAMNKMGYDAATLGNHEFDYGLDTLAARLRMAQFPIVCANYDVKGTPLEGLVQPYTIVERQGLRIGIFGLGVSDTSLILSKNFYPVRYTDPIEATKKSVKTLREDEQCDVVVCLSHLGFTFDRTLVCDSMLIAQTTGVDAVIGGHTHMMVTKHINNAAGDSVPVAQMLKTGSYLGKMILNLKW
ncbi:MAG TPA: metallophosphatase [Bacteroidales bacterium]|nr:metallophosphatase [Bacteroidales bacterium]